MFNKKQLVFSYSLSHLALMSFSFGYIDLNSFYRFTIYASMQTGNMIRVALLIATPVPADEFSDSSQLILKVGRVGCENTVCLL